MSRIKSFDELKKIREEVLNKVDLREKGEKVEEMIQVHIAMATCGIAAGARTVMNQFLEECQQRDIQNVVITKTGCMGYCYAEPTVEVTLPGQEPVVFGDVDQERVKEIIEKYIQNGELIDGIVPATHRTIRE